MDSIDLKLNSSGVFKKNSVVKEVYTIVDLLQENYLSSNFSFCFELFKANKEKTKEVLDSFKMFPRVFNNTLSSKTMFYEGISFNGTEVLVIVDLVDFQSGCYIQVFAQTLESAHLVYDTLYHKAVKDFLSKDEIMISFSDFSVGANGTLKEDTKRLKIDSFKTISEKYYPFISMNIFMEEFLTRKESLLILTGESGTGKTKFASLVLKLAAQNYELVENMIEANRLEEEDGEQEDQLELRVAYFKNEDILATDSFWSLLKERRFDFVILDDLDYMLLPRTREAESQIDINRSKFISQLLSFTDGVIPTTTKFIITSNKSDKDVDPALMRAGRMFDILSFRPLEKEEAICIWNEAKLESKKDIFEEHFKNNNCIYHAELGSLIYQTKLTSGRKNYLKTGEEKASLTEKTKSEAKKKIGF